MSQRSIVIVVCVVLLAPVFAAADGGSIKTIPLNRKELAPGKTWWCWTRPDTGSCMRTRERCENLGDRCTEQKTAYAFSARFRTARNSREVLDGGPDVFDSKEHCESMRRAYAKQDGRDPARDPEVVGLSACTVVGAKALPPLKPLPAGNGFWCFAYAVNRTPFSVCVRSKRHCERAEETIGSGVLEKTFGQRVTITSECELRKKGWAWIASDQSSRWYSDVYADQQACEALRMGAGEACREVR